MLTLRSVTSDDSRLLFDWVNQPDSLAGKLQTRCAISWDDHQAWMQRRLNDPHSLLAIVEQDGRPIGQIRLQGGEGEAYNVDIYILSDNRGRGIGRSVLAEAAGMAARRWPECLLRALVRTDNAASRALFAAAGYKLTETTDSHFVFMLKPMPSKSYENSLTHYKRASETIPLATQTFSKSAQNYVFGCTPLFIERGDGGRVWDIDGNVFIDYVLGLLPVVLGYRDPDVDAAIREQLDRGIVFSLASRLEAEVAERLVRLIPCAEMVRFGKNGSDATTAAVRLARACTGRDRVAVCGYHGWHDWYIGSTTRDLGVPAAVKALTTALPFNDLQAVADCLQREDVAALVLEPAGIVDPAPGYLEGLRELTQKHGTLLVFDEIVTGFRINMGGAQAEYGVAPDLAAFGKAMGNGMPISAVVGRRDLMRRMEDIFFSGTFGGEALSLAAAAATIDKLEREQAVPRMRHLGRRLALAAGRQLVEHGLDKQIKLGGPDWWPRLMIADPGPAGAVTVTSLLRQELITSGLLMSGAFNLCLAHDQPGIEAQTVAALGTAFAALAGAMADKDPAKYLRGEPVRPVFQVRKS